MSEESKIVGVEPEKPIEIKRPPSADLVSGMVVVHSGERSYFGKPGKIEEDGMMLLSEVFSYHSSFMVGQRGPQWNQLIVPLEGGVSLPKVRVRVDSIFYLDTFDKQDREGFARLFEQAQSLLKQIKAARAGVLLSASGGIKQ